jgi:CRP-like cAMP-binding protein
MLMSDQDTPRQNHLLAALSEAEYQRIFPHLERIAMPLGTVLYESGNELCYAYFPTNCIVSLLYVMESGAPAEIAMVGNDGIIGVSIFMGGGTMPNQAVVRNAGFAYRLRTHQLMGEFNRSGGRRKGTLRDLLLRYTQVLITQIAQTAVCNRHHFLDQQLCRWLLLSLDRLGSNNLIITQELIAHMLGVRREGVTQAAGKLQQAGLIDYSRGHITVLDRPGLEARVCECYQVVKTEFDRLLPYLPCAPLPPLENGCLKNANNHSQPIIHPLVIDRNI